MLEARREELAKISIEVRKDVVRMVGVARSYGLASALAITDVLVYLYWECMNIRAEERNRRDGDRFVLGESAAAPTLYACLARRGYFEREELWNYRRLGTMLQGCPDIRTPGVDAPGGLYGGGVGIASGMALALAMKGWNSRVFCVTGGGEFCEGSVWESLYSASKMRTRNLVMIVDANEDCYDGSVTDLMDSASLFIKLESFGWFVTVADGHDFDSLEMALGSLSYDDERPKAIIARTSTEKITEMLPQSVGDSSKPMSSDDMDKALTILESETTRNGRKTA